jgi:hypothetical protein
MATEQEDFRSVVKAYIEMIDEIASYQKQIREIRKKKDKVGEIVMQYMRDREVDECELRDGKLVRKTSKRTEGLKKEHILAQLLKLTNGNETTATEHLNAINSMRGIKETEILSRTRKRNPVAGEDDDSP